MVMDFNLDPEYQRVLDTIPRGVGSQPINYGCNVVKRSVTVDKYGNCFLCKCDGWLPIPVGQAKDFDSFEEIFETPIAQYLHDDIEKRNYTYCAVDTCGIRSGPQKCPYSLYINLDESCNLHCPSCRKEQILVTDGPVYKEKLQHLDKILKWLYNTDKELQVTLTGNGDPLASHIFRPLLKNWPDNNHTIELHTNGLLVKKQLQDQPVLNKIAHFSISVDAGSKEVYENVRLPGKWKNLIENLDFIKTTRIKTSLNFVLQNANYFDLENYCRLVEQYGFGGVVTKLVDWDTWGQTNDQWSLKHGGNFFQQNCLDPTHNNWHITRQLVSDCMKNYKGIRFEPAVISSLEL